jgi:hypothetical protein
MGEAGTRRGLALITLAAALLALHLTVDASARPLRTVYATSATIEAPVGSVSAIAGSALSISGWTRSKGGSCRSGRRVFLHVVSASGDVLAGTTKTSKKGRWTIAALTPGGSFYSYVKVTGKKTKKAVCRRATSQSVVFAATPPTSAPSAPPAVNYTVG